MASIQLKMPHCSESATVPASAKTTSDTAPVADSNEKYLRRNKQGQDRLSLGLLAVRAGVKGGTARIGRRRDSRSWREEKARRSPERIQNRKVYRTIHGAFEINRNLRTNLYRQRGGGSATAVKETKSADYSSESAAAPFTAISAPHTAPADNRDVKDRHGDERGYNRLH